MRSTSCKTRSTKAARITEGLSEDVDNWLSSDHVSALLQKEGVKLPDISAPMLRRGRGSWIKGGALDDYAARAG